MRSTYDAKGQFLLFGIDGAGDAVVKLSKYKAIYNHGVRGF